MADDHSFDTPPRPAAPGAAAPAPQAAPQPAPPPAAPPKGSNARRTRMFALFGLALVVAALAYGAYYVLVLSHYVSTDDAYVGADVASITPQVAGQIAEVRVHDTQAVKAGDVLVVIDPADARLALAQAQADYDRAVRKVTQYFANDTAASAQINASDAELDRAKALLAAAQSDVERTGIDLKRREALAKSGAVSGEELTTAQNAYRNAIANVDAVKAQGAQAVAAKAVAQGQLAASQALTAGSTNAENPEVMLAKAALDTAKLNYARTVLRAPFDGVVAQRQVQVGQRVAIGAQLMTVVPIGQVYVNANFKESQLRKMHPGQPAEVIADRYGKGVVFHGHVEGMSGGTGSAFALIPAQNATGNWIKVVQRLPVRIDIDPRDLSAHPLRVGLSTEVKVDVTAPSRDGR